MEQTMVKQESNIAKAMEDTIHRITDGFKRKQLEEHIDVYKDIMDKSDSEKIRFIMDLNDKVPSYYTRSTIAHFIRQTINDNYNERLFTIYIKHQDHIEDWLSQYFQKLNNTHVCCSDYARFVIQTFISENIDWNPQEEHVYWIPPIGNKQDWLDFVASKLRSYDKIFSFNLLYNHIKLYIKSYPRKFMLWITQPYRKFLFYKGRKEEWKNYIILYNKKHDTDIPTNRANKYIKYRDFYIINKVFGLDIKWYQEIKFIKDLKKEEEK